MSSLRRDSYATVRVNLELVSPGCMGVAEGASGASADAPGVGLELVSVSFSHKKEGEKLECREKETFKNEKEENRKK